MTSRRGANYDSSFPTRSQPVFNTQYSSSQASSSQSHKPQFHSRLLDTVHTYASIADQKLSNAGAPLKPYLPLIGRTLAVISFLEDTLRIVANWNEQVNYIWKYKGLPWILTEIFFVLNVIFMIVGSFFIITKRQLVVGVGFLVTVLVSQTLVYRLFNLQFFARSVSMAGGLLLVLSDVFSREKRRLPGLPEMDPKDRSQNFILIGRILIVVQFVAHMVRTQWTPGTILLNIFSVTSCILLVVGYKARISASLLALLLLVQNLVLNSYWRMSTWNPTRDMKRHEHFQTLSIVGGLILLVNLGAGKLSFDEKRKIY